MTASIVKKSIPLREQVFDAILAELRNGAFANGERLTEEGLAKLLKVSRTPIREALGQLVKQGVLRPRPKGGYVVPSPSVEEVHDIIAVRMLLEPTAVRMAAEQYGAKQIDRIHNAIAHEVNSTGVRNPQSFARANEEFRQAIFGGISNAALRAAIAQFANHLQFIRAVTLDDLELRKQIVARQMEIHEAIKSGDGARAEKYWEAYLRMAEDALIAAMQQAEPQSAPAIKKTPRGGSRRATARPEAV